MRTTSLPVGALAAFVALMPHSAYAVTVLQVFGYLEIFIGLFLAISIVVYVGSMIVYFVRLGTIHREDTFVYMYFSITVLFMLSILLAAIHFLQKHTEATLFVVAIFVLFAVAWLIIKLAKGKKEESHDEWK